MKTYQATSDSSDVYRERTGDFGGWSASTADGAPAVLSTGGVVMLQQVPMAKVVPAASGLATVTYASLSRD